MSTRWSTATKFWVLTAGTVILFLTLYRLRSIVPLVVLAFILAYILNPVVSRVENRYALNRTLVTGLVYLALLAVLLTLPALVVPVIIQQASALDSSIIEEAITTAILRIQSYSELATISIFGFTIDLTPLYDQLIASLRNVSPSLASGSINFFVNFASGFASTLVGLLLILVLSFYLVKDSHIIARYLEHSIPRAYRDEVVGIVTEINQVWRDFLRGQLLLVAVVGVVTWLGLMILGVPNALLLGILAGLLELIPNLGPTLAAIPAVLIAYFQGSTHLGLAPPWFALAVLGLYIGIQQVENAVLVPRIIGGSVHLHPVVILIGILGGAAVAGILGIFLAAPVLASLRVIGSYVYTKLTEPSEAALAPDLQVADQPTATVDDQPAVVVPSVERDDASSRLAESSPTPKALDRDRA
jgi:predicted PurR-regulated permease PerM